MKPIRKHLALAIDGGGIKGLIVAQALTALEKELGDQPLIKRPELKIMAGTSTGAIITGSIAMGMSTKDIAQVYVDLGQTVFPRLSPAWFPPFLEKFAEFLKVVTQPHLYNNDKLIEVLRTYIQKHTGKADLTLAELNEMLGPEKTVIFTAVDISARRTHFIKSSSAKDGNWKLWEGILASSSAPIALPVWTRNENTKDIYYTDGGVGNYGNPAYVTAQEAIVFRGYQPQDVSLFTFGTGWVDTDNFQRAAGIPAKWKGLDWAQNAPNVLVGDAARAQSMDIIEGVGHREIDFRRFQFALENDIAADAYGDDKTYEFMRKLGDEVGQRILKDQYAPNDDPQFDPEGLQAGLLKFRKAQDEAKVLHHQ